MTQEELKSVLDSTGLPVTYSHWENEPKPPYIAYLFNDSDNFGADNKVYHKVNNFQVELYSSIKDLASEKILEVLFDANEIFYEKSETWVETEKLYQAVYEISI